MYTPDDRKETAFVEYTISSSGLLTGVEVSHLNMLALGQAFKVRCCRQEGWNETKGGEVLELPIHVQLQSGLLCSEICYTCSHAFASTCTHAVIGSFLAHLLGVWPVVLIHVCACLHARVHL